MNQNINQNQQVATPNVLTIFLDTNVEGNQFFVYKPTMTNPSSRNKNVLLDPYIKYKELTKEEIKNKPSPFIDKGLFK